MGLRIPREELAIPVMAVVTAMLVGMIFIAITGYDPFYAYTALIQGMVGSPTAIGRTLIYATPLILTGLAVALAFRAGLFNIGGQGQMVLGMILGGAVALKLDLPSVGRVPLELLVGAAAGAAWGAIAGFLKAVRGAHEVITTIMLNYIAYRIGEYLLRVGGPLQEAGNSNPQSEQFEPAARMPVIWRPDPFNEVHVGLLIALGMAVVMWFLLERTSLGYQIRAVGLNPEAARYGGMNVARVTIIAMAIAGAFAGIAGVGYAMGDLSQMSKNDFGTVQAGFTGIAVALLGRNTPIGVVLAALLFGGLASGATQIQAAEALEPGSGPKLVDVIQGCIIFFVGADAIFRSLSARIARSRGDRAAGEAAL